MSNKNGYDQYRYDGYTVYGTISPQNEEHTVEDARTPKQLPQESKNVRKKEKQKSKIKKSRKRAIIVCVTIFLFSLTVFLADIISGNASFATYASLFKKDKLNYTPYYAVYATHSEDMGISYRNASVIHKEGGAGYVLKNEDMYYVIVSVYSDKKDAQSVIDKNDNYAMLTLKVYDYSYERQPSLVHMESGKDLYKKTYEALYSIGNELAAGKYGNDEMKKKIIPLREELAAYEESYKASISGKEDTAEIEFKVQLKEMISAFDNMTSIENGSAAEARYYSAMIIHSYSIFSEKYFK